MLEMDAEVQGVKAAIESAFASNRFPGDRPEQLVCDTIPPERERLVPLFAGKRWEDWKDRPLDMFKPHAYSGGLIFLQPDAFRYYLPIFLLAGLLHPREGGNILSDAFHLLGSDNPDWGRAMVFEEMTRPQLLAVLRMIDYLDRRYGSYQPLYREELGRIRSFLNRCLIPRR